MSRFSSLLLRTLGGVVFVAACAVQGASPVQALAIHPAILDVEIDPGQASQQTITLQNDDRVTETYIVSIQKFIPLGDYGQQQFLDPSDTAGLPEWMFVDRSEITLAPGRSANLGVTIRVPENAQSGGYYVALFFSRSRNADEQLAMLPKIGALFFVRVNGPVVEKLALEDFSTDAAGYEYRPIGFRARIVNEGNVHLSPEGVIHVTNLFGTNVAVIPLNEASVKVLPSSERVLDAVWTGGSSDQGTGFWKGLRRELSGFAFGPHTATIELTGRGISSPTSANVRFSVWPWRTGVASLVLVLGLILIFFIFKKIVIASATARSERK